MNLFLAILFVLAGANVGATAAADAGVGPVQAAVVAAAGVGR